MMVVENTIATRYSAALRLRRSGIPPDVLLAAVVWPTEAFDNAFARLLEEGCSRCRADLDEDGFCSTCGHTVARD